MNSVYNLNITYGRSIVEYQLIYTFVLIGYKKVF